MKKKIYITLILCFASIQLFAQFDLPLELTEEFNNVRQVDSIDIDQDGDLDLLATSDCKLFWYRNTSGTFEPEQHIILMDSLCSISQTVIADINNDGDLDICLVKRQAPSYDIFIYTLDNLGGGNFDLPIIASTSFDSNNGPFIELGDLDNDGNDDMLEIHYTVSNTSALSWSKGNGNGSFMPFQLLNANCTAKCKLSDYDLDGDLDIFFYHGNYLYVQKNLGSVQFSPNDTIAQLFSQYLDFVDLNGDSYLDVTVGNNSILNALINNAGVFGSSVSIPLSFSGINSLNHGDFDDDGDQDVLVNFVGTTYEFGTSALGWYENNGLGALSNFQMIDPYAMGLLDTSVADYTGDGKVDVAATMGLAQFSNDNILALYPYTLSGIQAPYTPIAIEADGVRSVIESDIDNDGLVDIVVTSYADKTVSWHKNLGNNTWGPMEIISEHATTPNNTGSTSSVAIDLDNDGDDDIITSAHLDATLSYYENLGGGVFSNETVLSTGFPGVFQLMKVDLNIDGFQDLVVISNTPNPEIVWLENNGSGALTTEHFIAIGGNNTILGDLDQDGNIDILRMNNGFITWHRNTGGGIFSAATTIVNVSLSYTRGLAIADLNGDGEMDLIIGSTQAWSNLSRVTVAYNNGGSTSFTPEIIQTYYGQIATGINVNDFDLDGDVDFLTQIGNGKSNLFDNLGNGQFNIQPISASLRGASFTTISLDVDNDGDFDVVNGSGDIGISILENLVIAPFKASGKIFVDLNQNGVFDGSDFGTDQFDISSTFPSALIELNSSGDYHIVYCDSAFGTYQSQPVLDSNWGISSASSGYQQVINGSYVNQVDNDFGIYPTTFENDVEIDITGGFPGCTDLVNLWVSTTNKGTTQSTGNYELTLANGLIYASSDFTPDSIIGQTIYWHMDSLFYFTDSLVSLQVATPSSAFAGDTLISTLVAHFSDSTIAPTLTVTDSIAQIINCTPTATHKSGIPWGAGTQGYIDPSTQSIEYLIRFENTSSSTAESVIVRDGLLDTNLVWSSVEVISSSHPISGISTSHAGQNVYFEFDHIQLPSVSADYIGSKGYVKFKIDIKPNRPFPTVIRNQSVPYFDGIMGANSNNTYHTLYDCGTMISTASLQTESCMNELIAGSVEDYVTSTNFVWTIPNVYTDLGTDFYWNADTAGIFPMNLTVSNEYCSADTNFTLTIHPKYTPQPDSVSVCIGDSLQIFGQYISTPGIYVDSLQTLHGCDSILSKELFELPIPSVTFYSLTTLTCINYAPILLDGVSPPNGQFVGPGIVSNTFDPSIAGVGVHTIFYHYTDPDGCTSSDSIQLVVDNCAGTVEFTYDSKFIAAYDIDNQLVIVSMEEITDCNYNLALYDMTGRKVLEELMISNEIKKLHTKSIEKGIYMILIEDTKQPKNVKFKKIYIY